MFAADSSILIDFFDRKETASDLDFLGHAFLTGSLRLPPVVLTEILSNANTRHSLELLIQDIPLLDIRDGYWQRASVIRSRLLSRGLKAKLADTLIAQSCIDHDTPLIARDTDFRHFAEHCGLKLVMA